MSNIHTQEEFDDCLHEECGVFGIYDFIKSYNLEI